MNNFNVDSEEKIALAKIGRLLTKYSKQVILENGDGENLLRCVGLSSMVNDYSDELTPYSFNTTPVKTYKNASEFFNPGLAINEICIRISDDKELLGKFLNEFLQRIRKIDNDDINKFSNYLGVLGYELEDEVEFELDIFQEKHNYSLLPYTEGVVERQEDTSFLINMLNRDNADLLPYYKEAISTYGNSEYKGCITNCRTLFEKFFKRLDTVDNDYSKGILEATSETITGGNTPRLSIKGIFNYWIDNKKGFNRYRLFVTMYSLMSGLGPHAEEVPTKEDALLCLRMTEDVLIWYYQKNNI